MQEKIFQVKGKIHQKETWKLRNGGKAGEKVCSWGDVADMFSPLHFLSSPESTNLRNKTEE